MQYGERSWYRHVCAVGGVLSILMMVTGNTIGFVLGSENTVFIWNQVTGTWAGRVFLLEASIFFFALTHVNFEYRCVIFHHQ